MPGQPKKNNGIRAEIERGLSLQRRGRLCATGGKCACREISKRMNPGIAGGSWAQWHDQPDSDQRRDLAGISGAQPARVLQLWAARRKRLSLVTGRLTENEERWARFPLREITWHKLDVAIKWSQGDDGQVAVFFDGSKAPAVTGTGPNMHNGFQHYLKLGM